MRFKFIGDYTNGHTGINAWGLDFEGREPLEVPPHLVDKFARHIEFERVEDGIRETEAEAEAHPLDHDGDGKPGGSLPDSVKPRKRGRPKKVTE